MLMGMLSITSGVPACWASMGDDPVQVKKRVGYVPETHHIYRWMRVREVIGFCKSLFPLVERPDVPRNGRSVRPRLGEESQASFEGDAGEAGIALGRCRTSRTLLLLDEPLSGLDPIAREEFLDGVLQTICDRGQTVLISSHMLDDVRRLADTVGILNEGKLVATQAISTPRC